MRSPTSPSTAVADVSPSTESAAAETATLRLGPFDRHGTTRARNDGRSIEVEHGIPGELVEAEIWGGKRPRGRILEVLEPAPDRIVPPCPYFREWDCGGCQWQQIEYPSQIQRKREMVDRAMRAARLDVAVSEVHALDDPWRYRWTAGISLGKRAGFRRHGSLAIVPIHDCPISHPLIGSLMAALNDAIDAGAVPDFRGRLRIDVRVVTAGSGDTLHLLVRPNEDSARPEEAALDALIGVLAGLPAVTGISIQGVEAVDTVKGELFAPTSIAGRQVWLAGSSFFQTNARLIPRLIARVRQEAHPLAGKRVADVYAGVGLFGLFLADEAADVTIIESDPLAVEAARGTAEAWDIRNARLVAEPAETALDGSEEYDIIVVDPPRSGLSEPVLDSMLDIEPDTILYVSCLADSLARDLQGLTEAGYGVESLELFDFYPQTYHVELLATLRR